MAKTLHIVNGDNTAEILKQTNLFGDILVWREMLCEGPICKLVSSDEFWKLRYAYFEENYGVSKLEYFDKTIKEIIQLDNLEGYTEVVLWFEFDLFCQVNLMALCTYLLTSFRKDIAYGLVCTGKVKGKERMQSLADFSTEEFPKLYENKLKITRHNLLFAEACWTIFVENNIEKLTAFNFNKSSKFKYFQLAMNQYLKTFPAENGLNEIQQKTLEIINSEPLTANEIVYKLLIWQQQETVYGFGDLQYFQTLKTLKKYYKIVDSTYYLNDEGLSKIEL
jgi:hypothetical protein